MAKCKFKVGDRVKPTKDNSNLITRNTMEVGTVTYVGKCGFADNDMMIKVLKHKDEKNEGLEFPVQSRFYEKVGEETIVVYRKGNKVIALDKSTGKKAEARCNPADKFDFHTGAKLAFDRLMGESDPEIKEVKRPAKMGEYVKIVDKTPVRSEAYKNGDIGMVTKKWEGGISVSFEDGKHSVWDNEYVVLENYKRNKEKEEIPVNEEITAFAKNVGDCIHAFEKVGLTHYEAIDFTQNIVFRKRG